MKHFLFFVSTEVSRHLEDKTKKIVVSLLYFVSLLLSVCLFLCVHIQVIAGAGMDVDFTIVSPDGTRLIIESRRSDGVHVLVLR